MKSRKCSIHFIKQFVAMLRLIRKLSPMLFLITVLDIILSSCAAFPSILYPKYIIDALVSGERIENILFLILQMIILSLFFAVSGIVLNIWREHLSLKMGFTLSNGVNKKSLNLDFDMFDDISTLDKQYYAFKVANDNNFVSLLASIRNFFVNLIILLGIIALTVTVDPWILIVALVVIIIQTILTSVSTKANLKFNEEGYPYMRRWEYVSRLATRPFYRKDILLYDAKEYIISKLESYNQFIFSFFKKLQKVQCRTGLLNSIVSNSYQLVIYVFLAFRVVSTQLTIGDFSLYLSALNRFVSSCTGMVQNIIGIRQKIQYFTYYNEFMQLESKYSKGTVKASEILNEDYTLKFEHVYFAYPGCDRYVLEDINLKINAKEKIAIVGENGAGKSTLVLLMMRLYEPSKGRITLNGIDIREINYNDYMSLFSTVFQDYNLYGYSVIENITFRENNDEATIAEIHKLIKENGLEERIATMPHGINTFLTREIDPEGEKLSGGEGQKLAIIRALYKNSDFIIFDEPTAALDPNAEYSIYLKFAEMTVGKTAVYISHRLASTRFCDKVLLLEKGKIAEFGSHNELMENKGKYFDMFSTQMKLYSE